MANNIEQRTYGAPVQGVRRSVLVVGPSGGGKSAVINALVQKSVAASQLGTRHVTRDHIVQIADINYRTDPPIALDFYDTRGFMDNELSFEQMLPDLQRMVMDKLTKVDFVIFVLPIGRCPASMTKELSATVAKLVEWGMLPEHVIVLLNKRDFITDEAVTSYVDEFRNTESIPKILRDNPTRLIPTCFMDVQTTDECARERAAKRVNGSVTAVLDLLLCRALTRPFEPRDILGRQQQARQDAQVRDLTRQLNSQHWWWMAVPAVAVAIIALLK